MGVVGVDDEVIAFDGFSVGEGDGSGVFSVVIYLYDFGIELNFSAVFFEGFCHACGDVRESALDVVDAVGVFDVGEDGEEGWAVPGRHAEVFCLEGEGEFEAFVGEVFAENVHDGLGGGDVGECFEEVSAEIAGEFVVGLEEAGEDFFELDGVVFHEAFVVSGFAGE